MRSCGFNSKPRGANMERHDRAAWRSAVGNLVAKLRPCHQLAMATAGDTGNLDLLLAGGGLANGLIALRLKSLRPELKVGIVEAAERLGGSHTWSFFETDLTSAQLDWIKPLIACRWPGYTVRFPGAARRLSTPYCSVTATSFASVVTAALSHRLRLNAPIREVRIDGVVLDNGERIGAGAVVDGRGPVAAPDLALGFQKFVGLEVKLARPHGMTEPVVMDATVDQMDGYRFFYLLPFDRDTALIEDTRYADDPDLDHGALEEAIGRYVRGRGWRIVDVLRREQGVLPVAMAGDVHAHLRHMGPAAQSGLRACLFHPTTGYSLPDAVRLADHLATISWRNGEDLARQLRRHAIDTWRSRRFYRLLDRMMFRAAAPTQRYRILERFYRLPQPLIERFYAAQSTTADKLRILVGRPPFPISAALPCLLER